MKTKSARLISPGLWLTTGTILITAGAVVTTDNAVAQMPLVVRWLLAAAVVVLIVILAHTGARLVRARWSMRVARAILSAAEGSDPWPGSSSIAVDLKQLGPEFSEAVDRVIRNLRVLKQDKRQSELVLQNMADGIIAVDSEGRITLFNATACQISGAGDTLALGRKLEETDVHPEITRLAYECVSINKVLKSEIKLPGWPQWVIGIRANPFREMFSKSDCAMIVLHDLTEVRRHEMNQKEFVANVSHELKTPITAVRTTAETLLSGAKNDEDVVDRFLNTIISESDRLSALIEDLLEIARRDAGIRKTERSHCNVSEVINRAVQVLRGQTERKDIRMEVDVPESLVGYFDEVQILQLIRNLADNAVKYTSEGGKVHIYAKEIDSDLVISVSDTGIGIPHGEVERVFERFYRVDKARSRRLGGTGLGLAIVKDIIESHNGKITVETQLGKGSNFTVILPGRVDG